MGIIDPWAACGWFYVKASEGEAALPPIPPPPTVPPVGPQDPDEVDVEHVSLDEELRKAMEVDAG